MKYFALLLIICGLAACGGASDPDTSYEGPSFQNEAAIGLAPSAAPPSLKRAGDFAEEAPSPLPEEGTGDPVSSGTQYIAYSHGLGLSLPRKALDPLLNQHLEACLKAGPQTCIILNSNINKPSEDYVSGWLSLRAKPNWIATFLEGVEEQATQLDGEVTSRSTQAEDLTRTILDTDARLAAQRTLQSRLEDLLQRRDGELGDLLAIEREFARVTGQIESLQSNLKALRLRVSMSSLDINYETKRSLTDGARSNPLTRALGDFFYNLASAIAAVITAFAVGLPWMLLIGLFVFIWLRAIWPWVKRRRSKS